MSEIKNYIIRDCLETNSEFSLYRSLRSFDQLHVILKFVNKVNEQNAYQILKNEYEYSLETENSPAILFSLGIDLHTDQPLLVLEDFASNTLKKIIALKTLSMPQIVSVAILIAEALECIHKSGKGLYLLAPCNILIGTDLKKIKIVGSQISSFMLNENHYCINPPINPDRSFRYIAPEQTGRLNTEVDNRADIFSLGVILYEMLTQVLPYEGKTSKDYYDLLTTFHPLPPHVLNPHIPEKLSNLIIKLLSIEPDERHYNAEQIKYELIKCLLQLKPISSEVELADYNKEIYDILTNRQLGLEDRQELNEFVETYKSIIKGGRVLMLITGDKEVTKSSIVSKWQRKIYSNLGYLLYCKFEPGKRNTPFGGILGGFRHLMFQLNAASDVMYNMLQSELPKAIWPFGNLLSSIIPEFKRFVSEDKEAKAEQATETTVKQALSKFLQFFSFKEIPLVIFLEDMHWADNMSLKFINDILETAQHVFFVGNYKINEINPNLPIGNYLDNLNLSDTHKKIIFNHTIDVPEFSSLLIEIFGESEKIQPLADVVVKKSRGNSFIAIHLIKLLIKQKLIHYSLSHKDWMWDLQLINDFSSVNNLSDLILSKFSILDKSGQSLLKKAAVIGKKFDLIILSTIQSQSEEKTQNQLNGALYEDLIQKRVEYDYRLTSNKMRVVEKKIDYYFVSDSVHRLIYSLLSKEEREELHYVVANTLYTLYNNFNRDAYLVEMTKQYNAGSRLMKDRKEKEKLISLNNAAGLKLKSSGHYFSAVEFFRIGIEHLPSDGWQVYYSLAFSLHENLAICELLLGKQREAETLFKLVSDKSKTFEEKVRAYIVPIGIYGQLNKYDDALRCAGEALKLFNIKFSPHPSRLRIIIAYIKLKGSLLFRTVEDLRKLPEATDKRAFLLGSIYNSVFHACFASAHIQLTVLNTLKMMNLFINYGSTEFSSMGLATYATLLTSDIFEDYEKGYQLGLLGLELGKRYPNSIATPTSAIIFYLFVSRWSQPVKNCISPLRELAKKAFEDGTDIYGVAAIVGIGTYSLIAGVHLNEILQEVKRNLDIVNKYKTPSAVATYNGFKEFCYTLMVTNEQIQPTDTTNTKNNDVLIILRTYTWKVARYVIMRDFKHALIIGDQLIAINKVFPNTPEWNIFYFYYSIALVEDIKTSDDKTKRKMLQKFCKKFQRWAKAAPCNFEHKYNLLLAEMSVLENNNEKAETLFKLALKLSQKYEFLHDEAFISERMAQFYLTRNKEQWLAAITNAYQKYALWGATKKLLSLEEQYPDLKVLVSKKENEKEQVSTTSKNI
jgi:predicted ATPase